MYYGVSGMRNAKQELGVRRRAVDPAWCSASPRLPRATPHTRGSQAPAIRDRLGRRVRTRPAAARQHVPERNLRAGGIQVRKGDRLVPLRWASDLKRLEARLTNPGSWLPASAWKQPKVRAYVPSRFKVCAAAVVVPDLDKPRQGRIVQMRPARIVALLPAAAQNVLRGRDWNARGAGPGCFAVTTNEARSLAKALDGAGPAAARKGGGINLNYKFDAPGPSRQVWIGFDPFLPHGETTCSGCG